MTDAGLYFVVASGFTLIFGLMRVVNMAHGAFFLLGGYIALKLQRENMVGEGGAFGLNGAAEVNLTHWIIPALVGTLLVGVLGLAMQQIFLRWNQGQVAPAGVDHDRDLDHPREIQMLAHFGGVAEDIAWPRNFDTFATNLLRRGRTGARPPAARHPRQDRGRRSGYSSGSG